MTDATGSSGTSSLKAWIRALELTAPIARDPSQTLPARIGSLAAQFGDAPALIFDERCVSFRELAQEMNRYARWGRQEGLGHGDVVCLMMTNHPSYIAIWLGLSHIGVTVSLVNTNLVGVSLAHSIDVAAARHVIVGDDLLGAVTDALPLLMSPVTCWSHGGNAPEFVRIDQAIQALPGEPLAPDEYQPATVNDRALLIYTSGTTGLPKAANVSHYRVAQWSYWFAGMLGTSPADRMYNCLPMYHSVGGVVAIGGALVSGGSVVIRKRFSARQFWDDVVRWECTLVQYIGELCRFLVSSPPHPLERAHHLRIATGNGLSRDVWERFQERFAIPRILEFYAATEANFSLFNCEGRTGAIGRVPPFLAHRFPVALVKFDVDADAPARGPDGFCLKCSVDEPGEAISKISNERSADGAPFDGYTDPAASRRKVLRDVFEPGDAWFRSGDLMRRDRDGFFYFVDRIGDTFRWKGENVSTTEVAQVVAETPGVTDVTVYGVSVPGADGRAGMVALTVNESFMLGALEQRLVDRLPEYARPVFLRFMREVEVTGTFKHSKQRLVEVGYDPSVTDDRMYVREHGRDGFSPMDQPTFERIQTGSIRL